MKRAIIRLTIWLAVGVAGLIVLVLLALLTGATYEQISRWQARKNYPAEGRLVDVGRTKLQIDCRGTGSPTVVFQSGLDMLGSLSWAAVHREVAATTRARARTAEQALFGAAPQTVRSIRGKSPRICMRRCVSPASVHRSSSSGIRSVVHTR